MSKIKCFSTVYIGCMLANICVYVYVRTAKMCRRNVAQVLHVVDEIQYTLMQWKKVWIFDHTIRPLLVTIQHREILVFAYFKLGSYYAFRLKRWKVGSRRTKMAANPFREATTSRFRDCTIFITNFYSRKVCFLQAVLEDNQRYQLLAVFG